MAAAGRVKDGVSFALTIGIKSSPASSPTSWCPSVRSQHLKLGTLLMLLLLVRLLCQHHSNQGGKYGRDIKGNARLLLGKLLTSQSALLMSFSRRGPFVCYRQIDKNAVSGYTGSQSAMHSLYCVQVNSREAAAAASLDFLFVSNGAPSQSLIIPLRFISRGARAIRRLTKRFDLPRIYPVLLEYFPSSFKAAQIQI